MLYLEKYKWSTEKNVSVTGFAWLGEEYFCGHDFVEQTQQHITDFGQFKDFVSRLNGQFSIVVKNEQETWATCCHTWSFPLFYKKSNKKYIVSDSPETLIKNSSKLEADAFQHLYFISFGVTPKETTLNNTVLQVRPGQLVCLSKHSKTTSFSPPFSNISKKQSSEKVSSEELEAHLTKSFEKYYTQIKDKQVLLPLTGGYDSRLLACLLKEYGHKNVICATWGRKESSEKRTAKKVASTLGFDYCPVDYSESMIRKFTTTKMFEDYVNFVGHHSSMPFFYEYFGLNYLLTNKVINQNTVAIPGHPGDYLRGAHLTPSMLNYSAHDFCAYILSRFGTSTPVTKPQKRLLIEYLAKNYFTDSKKSLLQKYELWDLEERQCKFIGNSSKIYSFFGLTYFLPLFEMSTLNFFQRIPYNQRINEELYNKTLENTFFRKYNVDFDLKIAKGNHLYQPKLKDFILSLVPHSVKTRYYPVNDSIFYKEITRELCHSIKTTEFKHPLRPHLYNSYIVQWYLKHLTINFSNTRKREKE